MSEPVLQLSSLQRSFLPDDITSYLLLLVRQFQYQYFTMYVAGFSEPFKLLRLCIFKLIYFQQIFMEISTDFLPLCNNNEFQLPN